jgi:hypothetical protein
MSQLDTDRVREIVRFEIWFFAFRAFAIAQIAVAVAVLVYRSQ